jgi:hypothetical protein
MKRIQAVLTAVLTTLLCIVLLGVLVHFAYIRRPCTEEISVVPHIDPDTSVDEFLYTTCKYYLSDSTDKTFSVRRNITR